MNGAEDDLAAARAVWQERLEREDGAGEMDNTEDGAGAEEDGMEGEEDTENDMGHIDEYFPEEIVSRFGLPETATERRSCVRGRLVNIEPLRRGSTTLLWIGRISSME